MGSNVPTSYNASARASYLPTWFHNFTSSAVKMFTLPSRHDIVNYHGVQTNSLVPREPRMEPFPDLKPPHPYQMTGGGKKTRKLKKKSKGVTKSKKTKMSIRRKKLKRS